MSRETTFQLRVCLAEPLKDYNQRGKPKKVPMTPAQRMQKMRQKKRESMTDEQHELWYQKERERVAACQAEQTKTKGGIQKKQKQQKEWNDWYRNSANRQQKQARRKKDRQRKKKAKLVS